MRLSPTRLLQRATTVLRRSPSAPKDPVISYGPRSDGRADPGEVVWAWVPYEEDPAQGKDRPVLIIAREGRTLVGLMLTSKDHDPRRQADAALGRRWMDVGTGAWDRQGRPSEVRLDRVLRLRDADVRREGAALEHGLFVLVVAEARQLHGWA